MTINDVFNILQSSDLIERHFNVSYLDIKGIADDSRKVRKGFVFIAISGLKLDANRFIDDSIRNGGILIISEKERTRNIPKNLAYIQVKNARKALSILSASWFSNPSRKLKLIGVTGTKGKTTVVHLIYHILNGMGYKTGMISTINAIINDEIYDTGLHVTNPEPLVLQGILKKMVDAKLEYAVVEVTSHGLDQERVYGMEFDIGVLTNITKEHLDYHKTFAKYREAKFKLLDASKMIVLNKDDLSYPIINTRFAAKKRLSYSQDSAADFLGVLEKIDKDLMFYKIMHENRSLKGKTKLIGRYNLYNVLAAVSSVFSLGVSISDSLKKISDFEPPKGHLEKIKNNIGLDIFIDFAHTPDSLENLLRLLNFRKKKRLICVFGSAGERDRKKRFKMGEIAAKLTDICVITAEDPRSEDVKIICKEIKRGCKNSGALDYFKNISGGHLFMTIPDRAEALYFTLNKIAKAGDTVVVCGKGHEKSMCYGNIEHSWSDSEVIRRIINNRYQKSAIVLAAGLGKRIKSDVPKVIQKLAEKPMLSYTINNLRMGGFDEVDIVVGHKSEIVKKEMGPTFNYIYQKKALGTGHAAYQAIKKITDKTANVLVMNGDDSAFYSPKTLAGIYEDHLKKSADVTFAYLKIDNPKGLGRIIKDKNKRLLKIVEENEANEDEKKISDVNVGLYVFNKNWFMENIKKVKKGKAGEYYITDLVKIGVKNHDRVNIYKLKDKKEWQGVNTPDQLKMADEKMRLIIENNENEL